MVTPFGFFEPVEVLREHLLALPRGAVDPLQLRTLLVAAPVRAGDACELERSELAGGGHVRTPTQVDVGRGTVGANIAVHPDHTLADDFTRILVVGGAARDIRDDLELERLVGEECRTLGRGMFLADERLVLLDQFPHPGVDPFEVRVVEVGAAGEFEVVVEAVGDGRTDRVLGSRKQIEHGLREEVRGRVPQDLPTLAGCTGDDRDRGVRVDRPVQIDQVAVEGDRECGLGETPADARSNLTTRGSGGIFALRTVGQRERDRGGHRPEVTGGPFPAWGRFAAV